MRSFTQNTIRKILVAGEDYQDRIDLFRMLVECDDNLNTMVSMLTAEPVKVEVPVERVKVVFAADTYEPNQTYRFAHNGGQIHAKINCIKAVRMATKVGLKEAKDLVEGYYFSNMPELFERAMMAEILATGYYIEKVR